MKISDDSTTAKIMANMEDPGVMALIKIPLTSLVILFIRIRVGSTMRLILQAHPGEKGETIYKDKSKLVSRMQSKVPPSTSI